MGDTDSGCDTCATWGHAQAVECAVVSTFHGVATAERGNIVDWLRGDAWGKQEFGAGASGLALEHAWHSGGPYTKGFKIQCSDHDADRRASHSERWQLFEEFCQAGEDWGSSQLIDEFEGTKRTRAKGRIFPSEPWRNSAVIICVPWLFHLEHGQLLFCEKSTHPRHPKAETEEIWLDSKNIPDLLNLLQGVF